MVVFEAAKQVENIQVLRGELFLLFQNLGAFFAGPFNVSTESLDSLAADQGKQKNNQSNDQKHSFCHFPKLLLFSKILVENRKYSDKIMQVLADPAQYNTSALG